MYKGNILITFRKLSTVINDARYPPSTDNRIKDVLRDILYYVYKTYVALMVVRGSGMMSHWLRTLINQSNCPFFFHLKSNLKSARSTRMAK